MTRATRALIDLNALRHNLSLARKAASHSRVMAVIKANAYGHGMLEVARALDEADAFAVATIDEALLLRREGITKNIVILEGCFSEQELQLVAQQHLDTVVHHPAQLEVIESLQTALSLSVWLKIDTGMHRLGIPAEQGAAFFHQLSECQAVRQPVRVMTHFANADDPSDDLTATQIGLFAKAFAADAFEVSLANSAGILAWPQSHAQWNRPGIMLYGASPLSDKTAMELGLQPVMTLESQLIAVNRFKKGDPIGYGGDYRCEKDMLIGVVAAGYGDGYPRQATTGTPVLINGKRSRVVGRVSMDMICVDLDDQPEAGIGDTVILWGRNLPVDEVARCCGTIAYELLCRVTARVPFSYSS